MSSASKNLANSDMKAGETLFDFLKRKKQVSLQSSLKSSAKRKTNQTSMTYYNSQVKRDDLVEDLDEIYEVKNQRTQRKDNNPKNGTFHESSDKKGRKMMSRTFVEMISPLKRQSVAYEEKSTQRNQHQQAEQSLKKSSNKKQKLSEEFSRKNLNSSIKILKQTLQNLIATGKRVKQRSHSIFIQIKPLLKIVQEGDNKNMSRRAEEVKQKLRTLEFQLKQFDLVDANATIEQFHLNLSEHLITTEAQCKAMYEKSEIQSHAQLKEEKDNIISQLLAQKQSAEHKIETLEKKLSKLQKIHSNCEQQSSQKLLSLHQNSQSKVNNLQGRIAQLQSQNSQLLQQVEDFAIKEKELNKKVKDLLFQKEEIERRLMQENVKVKAGKEEYLLNEIMILKQEFQSDMDQVAKLYLAKESDLKAIIEKQKIQVSELKKHIERIGQDHSRTLSDNEGMKNLAIKYKRQNQCLVTDMHRMNEELYQHWMALKDIKTLAGRLEIMPKFAKIYQDIPFNDQLFS